jgi:16S rRNA (guanine527-N7)-methyltransferase
MINPIPLCLIFLVCASQVIPRGVHSFQISSPIHRTSVIQVDQKRSSFVPSPFFATTVPDDEVNESSAPLYSLDPNSDLAVQICKETLKFSDKQVQQIQLLSDAVMEWNERINLVSRKDCTTSTIFGRHVLPSLAAVGDENIGPALFANAKRVIDVGTGGGFPGLPLAIAYPETEFVLLDSVGKKLTAVQGIADQIGLKNVKTYHGRAEEYRLEDKTMNFDVATGRSVSALPQFCAWVNHLLKPEGGHLVYWIGGEIESNIMYRTTYSNQIQNVFAADSSSADSNDANIVVSDKQMLVFPSKAVAQLAKESGIKLSRPKNNTSNNSTKRSSSVRIYQV